MPAAIAPRNPQPTEQGQRSNTRPRGYQSGLLPAEPRRELPFPSFLRATFPGRSPPQPHEVLLENTSDTPVARSQVCSIFLLWLMSASLTFWGPGWSPAHGVRRGRGRGLGSAELGDSPLSQQVEAAHCVLLRPANCLLGAPPRAQPWRQSVRPRVPRVPGGHPGPRAIVCPSSVCSEGSDSQIFQPRVQASSLLVSRVPFRQRCRCTQAVG